jgi:uncharacterized protein YdhG (YjbR/CyaY superfamily)
MPVNLMANRMAEVDAYLQGLTPERRAALETLREMVFEVVPEVVETFKYRMPTYGYDGEMMCAFASQKRYVSLYLDTGLVEKYRDRLEGLNIGKSCIRFKKLEALPLDVVRLMLKEAAAVQ